MARFPVPGPPPVAPYAGKVVRERPDLRFSSEKGGVVETTWAAGHWPYRQEFGGWGRPPACSQEPGPNVQLCGHCGPAKQDTARAAQTLVTVRRVRSGAPSDQTDLSKGRNRLGADSLGVDGR